MECVSTVTNELICKGNFPSLVCDIDIFNKYTLYRLFTILYQTLN